MPNLVKQWIECLLKEWISSTFIEKAKEIHGQKNILMVSHVSIKCNLCNCSWSSTICVHINRKSCCAKRLRYTLEIFITKAREIYEEKYDYSQIKEEHIKGCKSRVSIRCTICDHEWSPMIRKHINDKNGCPKYSRHEWNKRQKI